MKYLPAVLLVAAYAAFSIPAQAQAVEFHVRCTDTANEGVQLCHKYSNGVLISRYWRVRQGSGFIEKIITD